MTSSPIAEVSRELLACSGRLQSLAGCSGLAHNLARFVGRLGQRLLRPPRIVLLGEFNAGKTTLANALIGAEVLPTSIHANTRVPIHLHYAERPSFALECCDRIRRPLTEPTLGLLGSGQGRLLHVGLPVERLRHFEVIDTPGLASGATHLDDLVVEACRRANIAVWCTASTQAWKASEEAAWSALPRRLHERGVLVATQADALNTDRDRERLVARLHEEAGPRFAGVAMIAGAAADEIRRHPLRPNYAERWSACGGETLELLLQRLIDHETAARTIAAQRILARSADRLAGMTALPRAEAA